MILGVFIHYLIILFLLQSLLFSIPYEEGEYISEEHQNISQRTCYPGNGYDENDFWKLADWSGALNGGYYNIVYIDMAASW